MCILIFIKDMGQLRSTHVLIFSYEYSYIADQSRKFTVCSLLFINNHKITFHLEKFSLIFFMRCNKKLAAFQHFVLRLFISTSSLGINDKEGALILKDT